jgi:hypothetical protein
VGFVVRLGRFQPEDLAEAFDLALDGALQEGFGRGFGVEDEVESGCEAQLLDFASLGLGPDQPADGGADVGLALVAVGRGSPFAVVLLVAQVALSVALQLFGEGERLADGPGEVVEGLGQADGLVVVAGLQGALLQVSGEDEAEPCELIEDEVGSLYDLGVGHEQKENMLGACCQAFSGFPSLPDVILGLVPRRT